MNTSAARCSAPTQRLRPAAQLLCLFCLAATLCCCAVGPSFTPPKPDVPAQWSPSATKPAEHATSQVSPQRPQTLDWWTTFEDPMLTSLIERCARENLDVREAVLRIEESRAQRSVTAAGLWPSLSANASYAHQRLSTNTPNGAIFGIAGHVPGLPPGVSITNPYDQYQLGLSASWELDLFGRVRRSVEAADADTLSSIENGRDVLISLESDVAQAYIDLRGAQLRRSIVTESLATQRELLDITRQRRDAGLTSDVDVENALSEVHSTEAQLPQLERELTQDINQLSRLMSRPPETLRSELSTARPVPPVPTAVPIGIPGDLARRRPDIRRTEASLHAATARVGVAVADLFPRFTISAAGGYQAQGLSHLIESASRFLNIGPSIDLPLFDAGQRRATIHLQDVRAQEAAIDYARTVLSALQEVENGVAAYTTDQDRRVSLEAASAASREALTLARQRYEGGVTSFIEVLDAERTLQQNELSLAETTTAVSTDLVALYKALGGGWENAPGGADSAPQKSVP